MSQANPLTKISKYFAVGFLLLAFPLHVHAASTAPPSGVTVSPAVVTVRLQPNDTENITTIGIKNNFTSTISLVAELRGVDEGNGILAPSKDLSDNLRQVISLDKTVFILQPGETTDLRVTVKNSSLLSPGGTYASVVIRQVASTNNSVGLQSAIGAGIFITKQDGAMQKLAVSNVSVQRFLYAEPRKVALSFKNEGNIHLTPRGIVLATNVTQTAMYEKGIINQESITVFPGKSVSLDVSMLKVSQSLIPGRQKLVVQYRFDGTERIDTIIKTIWYIPNYVYGIGAVLLITIYLFVRRIKNNSKNKAVTKKVTPTANKIETNQKKIAVHDQTDGEKIHVRKG